VERFWAAQTSDGGRKPFWLCQLLSAIIHGMTGMLDKLEALSMRFIIIIVSVLMILGLAAFGVVSAQKMATARSQATASD
jgi:uncharacterized membrane protein YhaH (DUF805 family)